MKPNKVKTRPYQIEIRDPDDELVTHSATFVHIERMDDNHWWMSISAGKETVIVNFSSKSRINALMERE